MVTNASVSTSILNKLHNAIFTHQVRELQAAGKIRVGWIHEERNLAYLLMKNNMAGNTRHFIVGIIFHNKVVKYKDDKNDDGTVG